MKRFEGIKQLQSHQQSAPHQEAIAFFRIRLQGCQAKTPEKENRKTSPAKDCINVWKVPTESKKLVDSPGGVPCYGLFSLPGGICLSKTSLVSKTMHPDKLSKPNDQWPKCLTATTAAVTSTAYGKKDILRKLKD